MSDVLLNVSLVTISLAVMAYLLYTLLFPERF